MIRIPAGNLFASASAIGSSCKFFQIARRRMLEEREPAIRIDLAHISVVIQAATVLKRAAALTACQAAAERLGEAFDRLPPASGPEMVLTEARVSELLSTLDYALQTFRDEVDARPMFLLPAGSIALLDQPEPPFGAAVDDAFPSSAEEIAEAARCLALERHTACVMHLMRALETPLGGLADRAGVERGANWNTLLNRIEARLRERKAEARDPEAEQWMTEAATQFRFIKNAWRNHAMHARATYDGSRAREIFDSVGAFLRQLADHLSEDEATPPSSGEA